MTNSTEFLAAKLRRHVVEMTHHGRSSHVGSCLSICDILSVLYGDMMKVNAKNHRCDERDRFILSKGHAGAAVYAVLAELGFFNVNELRIIKGRKTTLIVNYSIFFIITILLI